MFVDTAGEEGGAGALRVFIAESVDARGEGEGVCACLEEKGSAIRKDRLPGLRKEHPRGLIVLNIVPTLTVSVRYARRKNENLKKNYGKGHEPLKWTSSCFLGGGGGGGVAINRQHSDWNGTYCCATTASSTSCKDRRRSNWCTRTVHDRGQFSTICKWHVSNAAANGRRGEGRGCMTP